jgi:hypothetical protein
MTDSLTLYRSLIKFVWQNGLHIHEARCIKRFVWAMVGLMKTAVISAFHRVTWSKV